MSNTGAAPRPIRPQSFAEASAEINKEFNENLSKKELKMASRLPKQPRANDELSLSGKIVVSVVALSLVTPFLILLWKWAIAIQF